MALPGLCPDRVRFLPRCLLGKVRGVDLGSLVIHLFENYYIRGLFFVCLTLFRTLSEKLESNYDCFMCLTLFRETKFSNANNLKHILLSSVEDQCKLNIIFVLCWYLYLVFPNNQTLAPFS